MDKDSNLRQTSKMIRFKTDLLIRIDVSSNHTFHVEQIMRKDQDYQLVAPTGVCWDIIMGA